MGGVDSLVAKRSRGLTPPLPGVPQTLREIPGEGRFGRRPAVVGLFFLDPLLAVVALPSGPTSL